jgi:uncharacterized protein YaaW (UPF0174 family)
MAGVLVKIEVGGVTYILDSATDVMKILSHSVLDDSIANSMVLTSSNADYQVTAGKTFNALGIIIEVGTVAGTMTIYQGDTADAVTVAKLTIGAAGTAYRIVIPLAFTIAASKFVTVQSTASGVQSNVILIGYEA